MSKKIYLAIEHAYKNLKSTNSRAGKDKMFYGTTKFVCLPKINDLTAITISVHLKLI